MTQYKAVAPYALPVVQRGCVVFMAAALVACAVTPATAPAVSEPYTAVSTTPDPASGPRNIRPVQSLTDAEMGAEGLSMRSDAPLKRVTPCGASPIGIWLMPGSGQSCGTSMAS